MTIKVRACLPRFPPCHSLLRDLPIRGLEVFVLIIRTSRRWVEIRFGLMIKDVLDHIVPYSTVLHVEFTRLHTSRSSFRLLVDIK